MSSGIKSSAQLRVRLSKDDMDFLIQLAHKLPGRANISQVVKDLIHNAREGAYALPLSMESQQKLESMALLLRRSPDLVVADALDAVESLSDDDEPPLLVLELKLIKTHRNRVKGSLQRHR